MGYLLSIVKIKREVDREREGRERDRYKQIKLGRKNSTKKVW